MEIFVGHCEAGSGDSLAQERIQTVLALEISEDVRRPVLPETPHTILFIFIAVVTILFSWSSEEIMGRKREHKGEFYALVALMAAGMLVMAEARDILMLYLSVEMVGLASYVMAGYMRTRLRSTEASLKYVIFGAVSSGIMLYGLSLLYGLTGATTFDGIWMALAAGDVQPFTLLVIIVLVIAGLGYKIAMVPFHFWCPDVYEGAPTPVAAFFSVGPKAAGFALMIRFFYSTLLAGPTLVFGLYWGPIKAFADRAIAGFGVR